MSPPTRTCGSTTGSPGAQLLREDLAALYDAFETPRAVRGDLEFLRGARAARSTWRAVRERALEAPVTTCCTSWSSATSSSTPRRCCRRCGSAASMPPSFAGPRAVHGTGLEMVEVAEGPFEIGAPPEGFAYDNERPRHTEHTGRFTIGRTPVTNATWLTFAEGGGYERREWWSDEGWAWKEEYDITHHAPAEAGDPDAPVVHVSWFEAAAFARAHDARLPTEIEWEKAATWGQLEGTGEVWEWTASHFTGYPGFVAHPYRGVLGGVLRRPLPGAARRLVRHAPARRLPALPQLGPPRTPAALRRSQDRAMKTALGDIEIVSRLGADERTLAFDVLDGLTKPFKEIPPKHFYDTEGSRLFEAITTLPEYYPTRTERAILTANAAHARRRRRRWPSWSSSAAACRPRRCCCWTRCATPRRSTATSRSTSPRSC